MGKKSKDLKNIAILGAGSWGNTLAYILSKKNITITLWTKYQDEYNKIINSNSFFKPKNIVLNKRINITTNLLNAIKGSEVIIIAVPTSAFEETLLRLKEEKISKRIILVSATKGITQEKFLTPSKLIKKIFPKNKFGILSGPNIALDVLSDTPIITVIASKDQKTGKKIQELISSTNFRVYYNKDVTGIEIAGALKNVIAIASGMSDGFGFNISTKAALISRGLLEIAKIAIKEGANPTTLLSAASIGDLIATCSSKDSRNYKVGFSLAKNKKLKTILKELGQVAEGVETVKSMIYLAKKHKVEVPIAKAVYDVISNRKSAKIALKELLNRPLPKEEFQF